MYSNYKIIDLQLNTDFRAHAALLEVYNFQPLSAYYCKECIEYVPSC